MSTAAIVMMLVSMAVIWGGLLASVISLLRHGTSDGTGGRRPDGANR